MTGRVAIYALPGALPGDNAGVRLRDRAEAWLGRRTDLREVEPTTPAGLGRKMIDSVTESARRYGFHATLKPPFRLAPDRTLADLRAAVAMTAEERRPVLVPRLTLTQMDGFFALVPGEAAPEVDALAADMVTSFDAFRAPPTDAEIARRNPDTLSARQRELLREWGYPYVLDEFRFHLTLTDRISPAERGPVRDALGSLFAQDLGTTLVLDTICLFTEDAPGAPFSLHSVHPCGLGVDLTAALGNSEGLR